MRVKFVIGRDGSVSTELVEHTTTLGATDEQRLKEMLGSDAVLQDPSSALTAIRSLVLFLRARHPSLHDWLTVMAKTADLTQLAEFTTHLGQTLRDDYRSTVHVMLEALGGRGFTAEDGFRISEGSWTMRVVGVLEDNRVDYEAGSGEDRKKIAATVQRGIFDVAGRLAPLELIEVALEPRRRGSGKRLASRLERLSDVLASVGYERPSAEALKKMMRRYQGKVSHPRS